MNGTIRYIVLVLVCTCLSLAVRAEQKETPAYAGMSTVSDTILQSIFQFSSLYSKVVDEYKADMYMKGLIDTKGFLKSVLDKEGYSLRNE